MDRNRLVTRKKRKHIVALRKESVDRNFKSAKLKWPVVMSLSARRAWIEISPFIDVPRVALRKESVDRNFGVFAIAVGFLESLSARRAWIEMLIIFFILSK